VRRRECKGGSAPYHANAHLCVCRECKGGSPHVHLSTHAYLAHAHLSTHADLRMRILRRMRKTHVHLCVCVCVRLYPHTRMHICVYVEIAQVDLRMSVFRRMRILRMRIFRRMRIASFDACTRRMCIFVCVYACAYILIHQKLT